MKNLLPEIGKYLNLADFFKMKQLSSNLKTKLDQTQHLVFKREAFNTFCPILFTPDNPFMQVPSLNQIILTLPQLYYRNNEFSSEEIINLINRFPKGEGDNRNAYFVHIRSFVIIRTSLKNLVSQSLPQINDVGTQDS